MTQVVADTGTETSRSVRRVESGRPRFRHGRFSRREKIWAVVTSVVLMTICLAWIYPFIWTVASSFKSTPEIFGSINPFGRG